MRLDIKAISYRTGDSLPIETVISPEEMAVSFQGFRLTRPLAFRGQLENAGDGIFKLNGRMATSFAGDCARCLNSVFTDLDISLTEFFRPAAPAGGDDDENSYRYDGWIVDIGQAIRDDLLLAMPQRLLCREDCRGLCPDCGSDLNDLDCGCAAKRMGKTSPFDELKKLL